MGAGYIAGSYFFVRVVMEQRFHRVHVGFLPITAFTIFMAIASFSHLDRFDQDHAAFWIWMGLYVTTPILVPLAWLANRRTDPGTPEPVELRLASSVRGLLAGVGAIQTIVALILLAVARDWGSFDTSNELSYVFVVGLGALLLGLLALELHMRRLTPA